MHRHVGTLVSHCRLSPGSGTALQSGTGLPLSRNVRKKAGFHKSFPIDRPDACRPPSGRRGFRRLSFCQNVSSALAGIAYSHTEVGTRGKYAILAPFAEDGMSAGKRVPLSKGTVESNFPRLRTEGSQARRAFRLTKRHFGLASFSLPDRGKIAFSAVRSAVFGRKIRRKPYFSGFSCGRKKCFLRRNGIFSRHENGRFYLTDVKNLPES